MKSARFNRGLDSAVMKPTAGARQFTHAFVIFSRIFIQRGHQILGCQVQGHSLQFVSGDALHIGSAMTGLRTLAIGAKIGAAGEAEAGSAGEQLAEE